jgi:hypothetical protein
MLFGGAVGVSLRVAPVQRCTITYPPCRRAALNRLVAIIPAVDGGSPMRPVARVGGAA